MKKFIAAVVVGLALATSSVMPADAAIKYVQASVRW
jgi:hypothetical protein